MIRLFNQYFPTRKILFFMGECTFITLAAFITLIFRGEFMYYARNPYVLFVNILLIMIIYQTSLFFSDFYSIGTAWSYRKLIIRLLFSLSIAFVFLGTLSTLVPYNHFTLKTLSTIVLVALTFLLPWRLLYNWLLNINESKKRVLILGSGKLARDIARITINDKELFLHVVGFLSSDPKLVGVSIVNPSVIGTFKDLSKVISDKQIDKIIVAMEERRGAIPLEDLLKYKSYGLTIDDGVNFYEKVTNQLLVEHINPSDLIFCDGFKLSTISIFFKRIYDILFSFLGIIISLPLFVITGLLIQIESPGPIFFRQVRVGKNEKLFNIYKFRSMLSDAEKATGPIMSFKNDQRITNIGLFIRKTRLDELPQLWNVLKGDMSFVGPRPERPVFVDKFKQHIPFYTQRFSLRPGITGWAQIKCHYASNTEQTVDKLRYELYYLKNFSLLFDLTIILRTIKVVLFAKGT